MIARSIERKTGSPARNNRRRGDGRINESDETSGWPAIRNRRRIFPRIRRRLLNQIKKIDPRHHGRAIIHSFSYRRRKCTASIARPARNARAPAYIYATHSRIRRSFRKPSYTTRASITAPVVYCRFMTRFNFLRPFGELRFLLRSFVFQGRFIGGGMKDENSRASSGTVLETRFAI